MRHILFSNGICTADILFDKTIFPSYYCIYTLWKARNGVRCWERTNKLASRQLSNLKEKQQKLVEFPPKLWSSHWNPMKFSAKLCETPRLLQEVLLWQMMEPFNMFWSRRTQPTQRIFFIGSHAAVPHANNLQLIINYQHIFFIKGEPK